MIWGIFGVLRFRSGLRFSVSHFDAFWLAAEELIDRTDPTESESNESDKAHEAVPSLITNFLGNLLKN